VMDPIDRMVMGGLLSVTPRPGFSAELLSALRQASHSPLHLVALDHVGRAPWTIAGAIAGAALGSAGAAALAYRRFARGRRA
jgi:hypothetical protein